MNISILDSLLEDYISENEFQIACGAYCLYELFWEKKYSLPQVAYVLDSFLQDPNFYFRSGKISDCLEQLERLAKIYKQDRFDNPSIVERCMQIIVHQPATLTLSQLSAKMELSSSYLSFVISKNTGSTFRNIIMGYKLILFVDILLHHPDKSIEDISYQIGYASIHQFSKGFKKYTKICPSSFKKNLLLIQCVEQHSLPRLASLA